MKIDKLFPTALIALNIGAAVVCAFTGDWKKGVYWLAAAVLNAAVTF